MKLPRAGEYMDTYAVSDDIVGEYRTELSPAGIEVVLDTRNFGVIYRYLDMIPLAIFFRMAPGEGAKLSVRGSERVFGPVLVFGYDGSPRGLTEFELNVLKQHTTMERYEDEYTVILNGVTKERIVNDKED